MPRPRLNTCSLHLWSLGIEEEFYILFPMFAWLLG